MDVRASDDERRRVIGALERHTADGRLSLDEFGERVERVWAARTRGELSLITSDLPETHATPPGGHQLAVTFALAAAALLLLALAYAMLR